MESEHEMPPADPITGLSLQQLLRLSLPKPITWLWGRDSAASTRVRWVVLSAAAVGTGDLLLIPAVQLTPELVKTVQHLEGCGIVTLGEPEPLDFAPLDELPIVAAGGDHNLRSVHRTLLTILVNQRAYLMERGVRIHAQLSQLQAEGEGLAGLTAAMGEISGRGILVQDKRLRVLAASASSTLNAIWDDVLTTLTEGEQLPEALRDRNKAGQEKVLLMQSLPGGLGRLVTPIVAGGVARGYLSLAGLDGEFDALDQLVAEQGALVCAVEMARVKAVREAEKRLKGDLLSAILYESLQPRDTHLWVQSMGLDLTASHAVLRFAWDGEKTPSLRRLETLVNGEVSEAGLKAIVEAMGAEVVCVCELPAEAARPEAATQIGEAVLRRGAQEYPSQPARCGVGMPIRDLGDWRDAFRQAGQALEMARRLEASRPLYFPDLSVYRLLLQLERHPELPAFKDEILGPLLAYESGAQLVETLEAYFAQNGNLSQAAEALFIHRNTLIYRMERIAEITGLDLDNTDTRLAVQLALRIHRMMGENPI